MSRPRKSLRNYVPALSTGLGAVTLEDDLAARIVTDTFVAGSAGGVNIVLNSLRTSNVLGIFMAAAGQSYNYSAYEVTAPTQSAYVFGLTTETMSGNRGIYGKLTLVQRK